MKNIPKNYTPPEGGDFKKFEDGNYLVKGFTWRTRTEESKRPMLVKSEKMAGMYGRLAWTLVDDTEGPPQSVQLHEMPLLALAFNPEAKIPVPPLETQAGPVSDYMELIQKIVNESGNTTSVSVKGDWVNYVEGTQIPDGHYIFRIIGITSKSEETGKPSWYRHDWPKGGHTNFVSLLCEILAQGSGKESNLKGARFIIKSPYGITYDEETDTNDWEKTDGGNWNKNAYEANALYELTAPDMFDPFEPSFEQKRNIVPYWIEKAGGFPMCPLMGFLETKTSKASGFKYYVVDFPKVSLAEYEVTQTIEEKREETVKSDNQLDLEACQIFADMMTFLGKGDAIKNGEFTYVGKEAAKRYLTPLREKGYIKGASLSDMDHLFILNVVSALLEHGDLTEVERKKVNEYHTMLSEMLVGLNVAKFNTEEDLPY